MIKHELGKILHISGHPVQVATEFEGLARNVRKSFCEALGDAIGEALFEECIKASKMSEEERDKDTEKQIKVAKNRDPEGAKISEMFAEELCERIFRGH